MENHFSEVVVVFLHDLHRSGPDYFFMCCERGKTFVCLNLRMLCRMSVCPSVFVHLNAACWVSVWCAGSGRTTVVFVRSCKWTRYTKCCFTWPLFLHSQAACWQSDFYSGRQICVELYLSWELPFNSFQNMEYFWPWVRDLFHSAGGLSFVRNLLYFQRAK